MLINYEKDRAKRTPPAFIKKYLYLKCNENNEHAGNKN